MVNMSNSVLGQTRSNKSNNVINMLKTWLNLKHGSPPMRQPRGLREFWRHMIFFLKTYGLILNIPHRGGNGRRSRPSVENRHDSAFS